MVGYLAQAAAKKLSLYLKDRITQERFAVFSFVLDASVLAEEITQMEEELNEEPFSDILCLKMTKNDAVSRHCWNWLFFLQLPVCRRDIWVCDTGS